MGSKERLTNQDLEELSTQLLRADEARLLAQSEANQTLSGVDSCVS